MDQKETNQERINEKKLTQKETKMLPKPKETKTEQKQNVSK